MTILNEKNNQLVIIVKNPTDSERDNVLKAIYAAIRWSALYQEQTNFLETNSLITLSDFMVNVMSAKMFLNDEKQEDLKIIYPSTSPDEDRERIAEALCDAIEWYGTVSDGNVLRDEDGEHLATISSLLKSLVRVKAINEKYLASEYA